jgi:hypothetical protein
LILLRSSPPRRICSVREISETPRPVPRRLRLMSSRSSGLGPEGRAHVDRAGAQPLPGSASSLSAPVLVLITNWNGA